MTANPNLITNYGAQAAPTGTGTSPDLVVLDNGQVRAKTDAAARGGLAKLQQMQNDLAALKSKWDNYRYDNGVGSVQLPE